MHVIYVYVALPDTCRICHTYPSCMYMYECTSNIYMHILCLVYTFIYVIHVHVYCRIPAKYIIHMTAKYLCICMHISHERALPYAYIYIYIYSVCVTERCIYIYIYTYIHIHTYMHISSLFCHARNTRPQLTKGFTDSFDILPGGHIVHAVLPSCESE